MPVTEWGRDPADRGHREGRVSECFLCFSLHSQGQPSGIPDPGYQGENVEKGRLSFCLRVSVRDHLGKLDIHRFMGPDGIHS